MTKKENEERETLIPKVDYDEALAMGPVEFTEKYLFPTMLREHGNGFGMSHWRSTVNEPGDDISSDGLRRPAPSCVSVMCIGGTMEAIVGRSPGGSTTYLGKLLGLNYDQADALFYEWQGPYEDYQRFRWSLQNQLRFVEAKTPLVKAKVAIDEVRLAIETNGKSLEHPVRRSHSERTN